MGKQGKSYLSDSNSHSSRDLSFVAWLHLSLLLMTLFTDELISLHVVLTHMIAMVSYRFVERLQIEDGLEGIESEETISVFFSSPHSQAEVEVPRRSRSRSPVQRKRSRFDDMQSLRWGLSRQTGKFEMSEITNDDSQSSGSTIYRLDCWSCCPLFQEAFLASRERKSEKMLARALGSSSPSLSLASYLVYECSMPRLFRKWGRSD